jgi:hypothetical protein
MIAIAKKFLALIICPLLVFVVGNKITVSRNIQLTDVDNSDTTLDTADYDPVLNDLSSITHEPPCNESKQEEPTLYCEHIYNTIGICLRCRREKPLIVNEDNSHILILYRTIDRLGRGYVPIRDRPYIGAETVYELPIDAEVFINANWKNKRGDLWLRTQCRGWIYSGDLFEIEHIYDELSEIDFFTCIV